MYYSIDFFNSSLHIATGHVGLCCVGWSVRYTIKEGLVMMKHTVLHCQQLKQQQ